MFKWQPSLFVCDEVHVICKFCKQFSSCTRHLKYHNCIDDLNSVNRKQKQHSNTKFARYLFLWIHTLPIFVQFSNRYAFWFFVFFFVSLFFYLSSSVCWWIRVKSLNTIVNQHRKRQLSHTHLKWMNHSRKWNRKQRIESTHTQNAVSKYV